MCTLLIAVDAHPGYPLVLAANRDEFYDRPTAPAAFWQQSPQLFAGRDLLHGGSWLGVTATGRIAALTNFRDPQSLMPHGLSRGHLVADFLTGTAAPEEYLDEARAKGQLYNGYNLVVGTVGGLLHYSNKSDEVTPLHAGIHGVSNHLLDTPWPKVVRGKDGLARVLATDDFSPEELFAVLADTTKASDDQLPETGVGLDWERLLSSIFISSERYGTRSSTVLLVDRNYRATFIERTFQRGNGKDGKGSDVRLEGAVRVASEVRMAGIR